MSSFDCSAGGSRDSLQKAHQNLETKFNEKFRSCFAVCVNVAEIGEREIGLGHS